MVWMLVVAAAVLCLLLYILCLKPNTGRRDQMRPFEAVYIAHRGLFDNDSLYPENSLPAFKRAVLGGYGIEMDVQLTADHELVVFHDAALKRMCGVNKVLHACTYDELQQYRLGISDEKIPLFSEALAIIRGKVPLIVEIKPEGDCIETARVLAEMMKGYRGMYCIESFHPFVVGWYRKHHPEVLRGQLSTDYKKQGEQRSGIERFVLSNLLLNFYAKPDFIAYNHKYSSQFSYKLCRKLYDVENAAWTIRTQEELEAARKVFQIFIFDSFIPKS